MAAAEVARARELKEKDPQTAIRILDNIVKSDVPITDEDATLAKEQAILEMGSLLKKTGQALELAGLIKFTRPFLSVVSKAKASKLVRALVDMFLDMEAATGQEIELCRECIEWAKEEKRTFLRQGLEARLVALYYEAKMYNEALPLSSSLLRELKKLDDKLLLVEVQLLESKTYHALSNLTKSRAALTSARTTANSIYCPPKLQAALDLQSGILHAEDDQDFKTAFSYFYEAFEGYDSFEVNSRAVIALKYMLLMKVMMNTADEVGNIVSGKLALKYIGREVDAMRQIADASKNRSLDLFKKTLTDYKPELVDDPIVRIHLDELYGTLFEQNLSRLIEPFSKVQVQHLADLIKLPKNVVETKLSQMILDKKFHGILDQGDGVLIVFDAAPVDKVYEDTLDIIQSMGKVVDSLYTKAKLLS